MLAQTGLARSAAIEALHARTAIYTQEAVVTQLLGIVNWPSGTRRLVDTSCGDGAFLGAALDRLLTTEPGISDDQICNVIEGWEIHPHAVEHARERLCAILMRHGRADPEACTLARQIVHSGDFLTEAPDHARYDTVVGNPPYLRMVRVPCPLRTEYQDAMPAYARHDLLHSFLAKCTRSLRGGGEIAMVTADRWLFNEAAAGLREVIGRTLGIHHLERLDATSCFYRPKYRKAGTPPRVHPVGVVLRPREHCHRVLSRAPVFPGGDSSTHTANRTLDDMATVQLAPWLGTKGVFLIDAATAASLPQQHLIPAVDSRDLAAGITSPRQFALRTSAAGSPSSITEHLQRTQHLMCKRGQRAQPWMPPEPFTSIDLSEECLVVPRIVNGLKAHRVRAGWLPINYNLVIRPRPGFTLADVESVLSSPASTTWVQQRAHKLEGGYVQISARLLRTLPASLPA